MEEQKRTKKLQIKKSKHGLLSLVGLVCVCWLGLIHKRSLAPPPPATSEYNPYSPTLGLHSSFAMSKIEQLTSISFTQCDPYNCQNHTSMLHDEGAMMLHMHIVRHF